MLGLLSLLLMLTSALGLAKALSIPISMVDAFLRDLPTSNNILNMSQILQGAKGFGDDPYSGVQFAWPRNGVVEPASDEVWCKVVSKGTTLLNSMLLSDANA